MARTKKVVKQAQKAPEPVEQKAPEPVEQKALPPAPPPPKVETPISAYWKRVLARRAKLKEDREKALLASGDKRKPPVAANELSAETVVEGKSVAAWDGLLSERAEVIEREREKGHVKSLTVCHEDVPGWALWAVREWNAAGRPSKASRALDEWRAIREKAENAQGNANRDKAKLAVAETDKEKVRLAKEVEKYSAKAAALFDEAEQKRDAIRKEFGV